MNKYLRVVLPMLLAGACLVALLVGLRGVVRAGPPTEASISPVAMTSAENIIRLLERSEKIEPTVLIELEEQGQTDYFIWMAEKSDLGPAHEMETKAAKGDFVYNRLRAAAERTQEDVRLLLNARGSDYRSYYIANKILVRGGDLALLQEVAARSDVSRITANHHYQMPELLDINPNPAQPQAVEDNLIFVNADDVWALGVTGQATVTHTGRITDTNTYTWTIPGTQLLTVTASNLLSTVTDTHSITITDVPPSGLVATNDSPTPLGGVTTLSATVDTGTNVTYTWDLGDGSALESGAIVTHTYASVGNYTGTVTATNSAGHVSADTIVTVIDHPITELLAFNDGPTTLGAPTTLSATIAAGTNVSYTWDFGDEMSGVGMVASHTYSEAGIYSAVVTATNSASTMTAKTVVTIMESMESLYLPLIIQGNDGGGDGDTETSGNNLSFPVLLADGASVTPIAETRFTKIYEGPYTGLTQEEQDWLHANGPWYAQKVEDNVWQAEFHPVSVVNVYFVDWGDQIEAVDPKIGRPYRLELALYAQLDPLALMTAYTMAELAFPSSSQETQGTNTAIYQSSYATISTPKGKLVVQRYEPGAELTWNAEAAQWEGAYPPESFGFAQELNVGGKYIFGASAGGWKPSQEGRYRITFYFEAGSGVNLLNAQPGDYNDGSPIIPKTGENNTAVVDFDNNITYIDVTAQPGSPGGVESKDD